jgi:hypothetical protein
MHPTPKYITGDLMDESLVQVAYFYDPDIGNYYYGQG